MLSSLDWLEFLDPNNLQTVIYTHSVKPHEAALLCVMPPSTVFYADNKHDEQSYIHRLECSGQTPIVCQSIGPLSHHVCGLSYVRYLNENLLVISVTRRLQTFKIDTEGVKWGKKDIQVPGQNKIFEPSYMAADGNGRLFVNDLNRCIHMFSVSDGQYLGRLIKEGEYGLGEIGALCFVESTSQLIVSHSKDENTFIAALDVE